MSEDAAARDAELRRAVTVLRDEAVVLDALQSHDADRIAEACAQPEFEQFLATPWPYERWHAEYFAGVYALQGWRSRRYLEWALREREGGALLGVIGLHAGPPTDLGYWLAEEGRGRGLMTRAVRLVAAFAFAHRVTEVRWEALADNHASAAVARRAGFEFVGAGPATVYRGAPQLPALGAGTPHLVADADGTPDAAPGARRDAAHSGAGASAAAAPEAWFAALRPGMPARPLPGWPAPVGEADGAARGTAPDRRAG